MQTCQICNRDLVTGPSIDEHHLIPRSKKGKDTITIHRMCHNAIHAIFTEVELSHYYNTPERILENEKIQKFVNWISKKAPEFYQKTKDTNARKGKRSR